MSRIRQTLGKIILSQSSFEFFQKLGIHIMRKSYYSPIPDTLLLSVKKIYGKKKNL